MKRMKQAVCAAVLLMSISVAASAQKKITGIYRTMNDYLGNQLSYSGDSSSVPTITLHTLAPRSYVTVQHKGDRKRIYKNEIFAYQLVNGHVYRVWGNNSFQVLNNNPQLLLYKRKIPASPKAGPEDQFKYYFSAKDGKVQELTAWNVKQAYASHPTLPDQIDALFKRDAELVAYDSFRGMYKLEWLMDKGSSE